MQKSSKILYHLVFFATLSVVVFSLFAIIFPSFLLTTFYPYTTNLQPFESSVWLIPIISSNSILLAIGFMYYRKKLPLQIYKGIEFILNFEISKKTALLTGITILVIYVGFSLPELAIDEATQYDDYDILKNALEIWPSTDSDDMYVDSDNFLDFSNLSPFFIKNTVLFRMLLFDASIVIFQNIKILPFVASILLVVVTFFLTYQITQKRFAGIISMVILLQSHTFLHFDTIAVYENFWVLFYVVSLYMINRRWQYSSISYLLAIFSKAFIAIFFLSSLYYICRATISTRKKLFTLVSYAASLIIILLVFSFGESIHFISQFPNFSSGGESNLSNIINISSSEFLLAFNVLGYALRYDLIIILSLLPLTLGLFFKFRKENSKKIDSILVLILTALVAGPVMAMLTDFYFILPYRFLPLIVFVAVGIGVLLSKRN